MDTPPSPSPGAHAAGSMTSHGLCGGTARAPSAAPPQVPSGRVRFMETAASTLSFNSLLFGVLAGNCGKHASLYP